MGPAARRSGRTARLRKRVACGCVAAWLACLWALPALGIEWRWGEFEGRLDSEVSSSISWRTQQPDCRLVADLGNPGSCSDPLDIVTQGTLINGDDGNLNWKKWDVFSVLFKGRHELDLRMRNVGSFVRFAYFVDAIQQDAQSTQRTDLAYDARFRGSVLEGGVVGAQFLLLDAYLWGDVDLWERQFGARVGNQVINWGESFFTQNGINQTNTLDVARLRLAGSELKDGLLPAPIVSLSGDIVSGLGFEAYYQFGWRQTDIDPVGTFLSVSDLVGRGAEGFFTPVFVGDPGGSGLTAEELFASGFAIGGGPLLGDDEANDQGELGVALRYYADALETELALYYLRYHDKTPSVSWLGECPAGLPGAICLLTPPQDGGAAIGYLRQFPEDIDLFGVSFSTVVAGLSIAGEVSYRLNEPTPITTALPDLTDDILFGPVGEVRGGFFPGFVREDRILAIFNLLAVWGPGVPLVGNVLSLIRAAEVNVIGEVAIQAYPSLSDALSYALPLGVTEVDPVALTTTWRLDVSYPRAFGTAVTLTPSVTVRWDAWGTQPGNGSLFYEGKKAVALQLTANYLQRYKVVIAYQNGIGGGVGNPDRDRDFLSAQFSWAF